MRYLTILFLAFLLSGCSRWLIESSSPQEIARIEAAIALVQQHKDKVEALADKLGQEEVARLVSESDTVLGALRSELQDQQTAPGKPRWSSLVDLLLVIGTASGLSWAAVAKRAKDSAEGVLRGVMTGVSEVRHTAKKNAVSLSAIDETLWTTYDEDTRHLIAKYRDKWGLEPVNG